MQTLSHTVNKAFTLIELLVVIVIIGILATISVSSFNGYLKKAKIAKSLSFEKQLQTKLSLCLVAKYDFEDQNNLGLDLGPNKYNGVNNGGTSVPGINDGNAVKLGGGKYIRNDDADFGKNPAITVSAWIKRKSSMHAKSPWGIGTGTEAKNIEGYNFGDQNIGIDLYGGPTISINKEYPEDEWIYIVWIKREGIINDQNVDIYVNGELIRDKIVKRNNFKNANLGKGITIGGVYKNQYSPSNIIIDNISFYNCAFE